MRAGRALSTVLITVGVLMMADAAATVVWEEPLTALRAEAGQGALDDELRALEAGGPTLGELRAIDGLGAGEERIPLLARSLARRAQDGKAVGRLVIPRMDLDTAVVDGSGTAALQRGPGLYDGQPYPGAGGTAAIAGHRTTYGAPFSDLDRLRRGDRVTVRMPYATLRYEVVRSRIQPPTDLRVLRDTGEERLVLSACHPRFSAAQRIVVEARLIEQTARRQPRSGRGG